MIKQQVNKLGLNSETFSFPKVYTDYQFSGGSNWFKLEFIFVLCRNALLNVDSKDAEAEKSSNDADDAQVGIEVFKDCSTKRG